ncbi:MAG: dephospho-CoA kinase [Microcoleus vaginatus WJT46-NPBG5]|jgi:dephospho-CoA kinase|nr:dephospho-CoA kinase [Microcoleus vaginatus WJT46-NPBG5]
MPSKLSNNFPSEGVPANSEPVTTQDSKLKIQDLEIAHKRIIGLTGGISTGKTTVSNYLANTHKLPTFDADIYAREAVNLGSPILREISKRYGADILLSDGNLDRKKLGQIIFNNPNERHWLEAQIHPYVRERLIHSSKRDICQGENSKNPIVLVVPLLFESNMTDLVTEIWVVSCAPAYQLERLMQRDHLTLEQAQARINSQMPIEEKCARADVVLDNSSTLKNLLKQVDMALTRQPLS